MSLVRILSAACLAAAAAAAAAAASAQEIVLYQGDNFNGPRYATTTSVADLARVGFNDRASSAVVRGGSWQLCADAYFRGQCVTLDPGNYPSLGAVGMNNAVSSVREVGWHGGGGPPPGPGPGPGPGGGWAGGSIVLFSAPGQTGGSYTVDRTIGNFQGTGFNDRAMSAVVNGGTWQLCSDADFSGSCEIFRPGRYQDLGSVTGRVSSARPVADGGGGGGPSWGGGGWGHGTRVVLYDAPNFQGRAYTVNTDVLNNLDHTGFNDRASSMRIERGYWMFCTDANFGGDCRTFGPGDYPTLSWLANKISSGRRISNDYPYNAPPRWGN